MDFFLRPNFCSVDYKISEKSTLKIVVICEGWIGLPATCVQFPLFPHHPHTKMALLSFLLQNMVGTGYYLKYGCSFYVPFYGFVHFFVIFWCNFLIVFKNNQFEYNVKVNSE